MSEAPEPVEPNVPAPNEREGPPAARLASHLEAPSTAGPGGLRPILDELAALDLAVYRAVAATPTPRLDEPIRRLSDVANNSKLWLGAAALLAVLGGRAGRRAAATGVVALAVNSAIVNIPLKRAGRRARPDRDLAGVPATRHVRMPRSPSFPSGHAASGFAFAAAVAGTMPGAAGPLRAVASVVGYSRVHTGVHYPGDVVIGALLGTTVGEAVSSVSRRWQAGRAAPQRSR